MTAAAGSSGIHQIFIRTLSGFRYLCHQLTYQVLLFQMARKKKTSERIPKSGAKKVSRILYQEFSKIGESCAKSSTLFCSTFLLNFFLPLAP
jgi:hypothetical protein